VQVQKWSLGVQHQFGANTCLTRGRGPSRLTQGWDVNGAVILLTGFPVTPVDLQTQSTQWVHALLAEKGGNKAG
jgi:hypothetical protein